MQRRQLRLSFGFHFKSLGMYFTFDDETLVSFGISCFQKQWKSFKFPWGVCWWGGYRWYFTICGLIINVKKDCFVTKNLPQITDPVVPNYYCDLQRNKKHRRWIWSEKCEVNRSMRSVRKYSDVMRIDFFRKKKTYANSIIK